MYIWASFPLLLPSDASAVFIPSSSNFWWCVLQLFHIHGYLHWNLEKDMFWEDMFSIRERVPLA